MEFVDQLRIEPKVLQLIVPNNCDEDIPEIYDDIRRGPLKIDDVPISILQQTEDYVLIDKPWDVRMYGNFNVTVEKLVTAWTNRTNLKWVHRLDYATSGILCVGFNTKFAAAASFSFEKRMVQKQYLAVLQGTVNPENYPNLPHLHFQTTRHKRKATTPAVETSNDQPTWQDQAMQQGLQLHLTTLQNFASEPHNLDPKLAEEMQTLQKITHEEYASNNKLRKRLRKLLKNLGILETICSQKSAFCSEEEELENSLLNGTVGATSAVDNEGNIKVWNHQNHTYRLSTDQITYLNTVSECKMTGNPLPSSLQSGQVGSGDLTNILWTNAPIQEIVGDFRMCIPDPEHELDGRRCETKMEILRYGTYQGKPVTKVLLTPVSGRRHQLRLHCLALNHPIVGDATYGSLADDDQSERMMLHAHNLSIRLKYKGIHGLVEGSAVDPFYFNETGELIISKWNQQHHNGGVNQEKDNSEDIQNIGVTFTSR